MADTTFVANLITAANRIKAAWLNVINLYAYQGRNANFAVTTGSANAQILTLATGSLYTAEADGDEFIFKAGFTNSAAMTLQIIPPGGTNTAGAVQINGGALTGGEVVAGQIYKALRLGATWQLSLFQASTFGASLLRATTALAARTLLLIDGTSRVIKAGDMASSMLGFSLTNGTLVPSQNGTVLTVAIKTFAGADPSATDPVYVLFRNATPGTADYTVIALVAATSITTTVSGTFGVANNVPFRLWVVGFNDGGVFRLSFINCLTTVAGAGTGRDVTAIFPLAGWGIASATQIGAGSTSAGVFYSAGAAVTSKAYTTLGYLTYESGLAAAGTFGVNQSRAELFSPNDPLPGQTIQAPRNDTGAFNSGTTILPNDDTIPQNTEGDQYMSQAITPTSAANVLDVDTVAYASAIASNRLVQFALFQDTTANALAAGAVYTDGPGTLFMICQPKIRKKILAAGTVATTFKLRMGAQDNSGINFNGGASVRKYGGAAHSYMEVAEVMA